MIQSTPQPEVTKHHDHEQTELVVQLKYKMVSCLNPSPGNRKVAGHSRQEIEGTDCMYADYGVSVISDQLTSEDNLPKYHIVYNIGRPIIVLPEYGDNLCYRRYH